MPETPDDVCPRCGQPQLRAGDGDATTNLQLGLFGEAVPVRQHAKRTREFASSGLDVGGRWQSPEQSEKDALAVVTELFHYDEAQPSETLARAEAVLAGKGAGDMRETAMAAAWFAAKLP